MACHRRPCCCRWLDPTALATIRMTSPSPDTLRRAPQTLPRLSTWIALSRARCDLPVPTPTTEEGEEVPTTARTVDRAIPVDLGRSVTVDLGIRVPFHANTNLETHKPISYHVKENNLQSTRRGVIGHVPLLHRSRISGP